MNKDKINRIRKRKINKIKDKLGLSCANLKLK